VAVRHVNAVERLFGLSNRCAAGDAEALGEIMGAYHQDARLESFLYETPKVGLGTDAIREYFEQVVSTYAEWQIVLDYVQDYDDRVLALGGFRSVRPGEREHEQAVGWIFRFRDDKVEAVTAYPSYGDALRAATVRAETLNVKNA
jgi:ketosteroid isomerase-like protein